MSAGLEVVASDRTALARADETRRQGVRDAMGTVRFVGLTRPEAEDALTALGGMDDLDEALVKVVLPVLLSDGAGPHLVDADGRLTLVVADHPAGPDRHVAIGEPLPGHRVGVVEPVRGGVWRWACRAEVAPADLARAIDTLLALDIERLHTWGRPGGPGAGSG